MPESATPSWWAEGSSGSRWRRTCDTRVDVTLVEMLPQVMPPLDPEMAAPLRGSSSAGEGAAEQHGLLRPSLAVRRSPDAGSGSAGDGRNCPRTGCSFHRCSSNSALAGTAGLQTGPRGGIVVNGRLQTSHPDIYAVGDAIQITDVLGAPAQIPLSGPANRQGRIAADNVFGAEREYRTTFGTSVVKVFGVTAASTGATEKALKKAGVEHEKIYLNPYSHATYYPGAQMMHFKLLFTREGRILGAQIVGLDGVDKRIDVLATAMQAGKSVHDLQDLELAYAPPYGSAKDPVSFAGTSRPTFCAVKQVVHADALLEALLLDVREPAEHAVGRYPAPG